jgi:tetratricopeptide (TPR) repeat protein
MMELLVEAERYLGLGLLDQAERLFRQVAEADSKSSIAAAGLARVALERGDDATAYAWGRRAVAIDPENPAAHHLVLRLEEVVRGRGETLPSDPEIAAITALNKTGPPAAPPPDSSAPDSAAPDSAGPVPASPAPRPGIIGRLLGRKRRP